MRIESAPSGPGLTEPSFAPVRGNAGTDDPTAQSSQVPRGSSGAYTTRFLDRMHGSTPDAVLAQSTTPRAITAATEVVVPRPAFQGRQGQWDPTVATNDGRRWLSSTDLVRYLTHSGHPNVTESDLIAANHNRVSVLNGRAVFEVGAKVNVVPGAARLAAAAGVDPLHGLELSAGISGVVGGNVGGPVSVYALTPVDPKTGRPDFAQTKIFYAIPGTPIVGTFKPGDGSLAGGFGASGQLGPFTLFGNIRLELSPNAATADGRVPTGFSVNAGVLAPLPNAPGEQAGVAVQGSVSAPVDWGLVMDVWSQIGGGFP